MGMYTGTLYVAYMNALPIARTNEQTRGGLVLITGGPDNLFEIWMIDEGFVWECYEVRI